MVTDEAVDLGTGYVQLQETLEKTRAELQRIRGHVEEAKEHLSYDEGYQNGPSSDLRRCNEALEQALKEPEHGNKEQPR